MNDPLLAEVARRLAQVVAQEVTDFEVLRWEGLDLVIIGSFDLAYYHDVELVFEEVFDLDLPFTFFAPVLREATPEECQRRDPCAAGLGERRVALDLDRGRTALVGCRTVRIREGRVSHSQPGP